MKDLRSPLAKAKGFGSSTDASQHFWLQRLTALALIPLTFWFCFSLAFLPHASYSELLAWIRFPLNTILLLLLIIFGLHHGQLGMQVIIEDYISAYSKRLAILIVFKGVTYFMMVVGLYSVLRITLGAQ